MIHEHHMSLRATIQDFSNRHTGGIIRVHSYSHYFPPPLGQIGATYIHVVSHRESHPYFTDRGSLVPSPLSRTQREGVWTNVYRARIARAMYSVLQSDAQIKSHDCVGMTGMQINDETSVFVHVRDRTLGTQWNITLIYFVFLIHAHQKYVISCMPQQHRPYTRLSRPLLSACAKGGWARD